MWLLLIAVLVAFYALWMAMTGRVGGAGSTELNKGGRAIVAGVALMAFGIAYAAYHPFDNGSEALADVASAHDAAAITSAAPAVQANRTPAGGAADTAAPADVKVETAQPTQGELKLETIESSEAIADDASGSQFSESAAAIEAQARRSPASAVPRSQADLVQSRSQRLRSLRRRNGRQPASSVPEVLATSPRLGRGSHRRLQIQIENQLGSDQQGEQLTLSIEGKAVADIDIDARRPAVIVKVGLPRPGRLHYRLEGLSNDGVGTRLKGEGCIRIDDGARYVRTPSR